MWRLVSTAGKFAVASVVLGVGASLAAAQAIVDQAQAEPMTAGAVGQADGIVLSFPENAPVASLVTYVGARLGINIVHSEPMDAFQFTLKGATPIPESALLDLLETVLQSHGLFLKQTEVPGLMQIVQGGHIGQIAAPGAEGEASGVVVRAFRVRHVRAEQVQLLVAPFITPGGILNAVQDAQVIVVADRAEKIDRIAEILATVDVPDAGPTMRAIPVRYADAQALLKSVQPLIAARANATQSGIGAIVTVDPRTNHLLAVGQATIVNEVAELVESLDTASQLERRVYRPKVVTPERLDAHLRKVLVPEPTPATYRAAGDSRAGTLLVSATAAAHEQIAAIVSELDQPPAAEDAPMRVYKLTNALAKDVAETIDILQGGTGRSGATRSRERRSRSIGGVLFEDYGDRRSRGSGRSSPESTGNETQAFYQPQAEGWTLEQTNGQTVTQDAPLAEGNLFESDLGVGSAFADRGGWGVNPDSGPRRRSRVAVDENTNSIIVIAPASEQRLYEEVIRQLDQRRPQVLVEVTVVTLDTSDGFSFGVDIGVGEEGEDGRIVSFSAFGLSTPDPDTGELGLEKIGTGGTLAILSPDIADVVIRALSTNSRSRLVSMPRILVNDNEEGILDSVDQVPYIVTVVPGGDFAVQSTDFADAGTRIIVVPHISDDDYLQLEYDVTLSSFTAPPQQELPPPIQDNNIASVVTIPDSHTIVVGGLNQQNATETISKIPILGDIPIIKHAFRSIDTTANNTTLFVFIRPTILRDAKFRDLKYISGLDRNRADIADSYPASEPMLMDPDTGADDADLLMPLEGSVPPLPE